MRSATRAKTGKDTAYLEFIRSLPCVVCCVSSWRSGLIWEMTGTVMLIGLRASEAAHTGPHGMSAKSDDRTAIPLCAEHHREGKLSYHKLGKNFFTNWDIDRDTIIAELQKRFKEAHELD